MSPSRLARASFAAACFFCGGTAWGDDAKTGAPESATESAADDFDVESIKKKYWATGDSSELGVVQNRLYSKAKKFQLNLGTGFAVSDPFLSLRPWTVGLGYNFDEFIGLNVHYMGISSKPSSALTTLRQGEKEANTVIPKSFLGAEVTGNLLYGKLSLLGYSILYYDFYLTGGLGQMKIETGKPWALTLGLGQRYYITQWLALRADYKVLRFKEEVVEKEVQQLLGQSQGFRTNWTHTFTVGLDFLVGFFE